MLNTTEREQLLREEVFKKRAVLGSTQTGSDWCLKALHPSDPMTEVRGIPDNSNIPTVCMNYQAVLTISPNSGATTPWSFEASLLPHPVNFMVADVSDSITPNGTYFNCPNVQILPAPATHADRYEAFRSMFQRWRLAYMSVTCYQDGPDLANQGTLCVSQPAVRPIEAYLTSYPPGGAAWNQGEYKTVGYTEEDLPAYAASQSMPSAYLGRSRDGAYVPLKLTETCQDWVSESDSCYVTEWTKTVTPLTEFLNVPVTNPGQIWPHVDLVPRYCNVNGGNLFVGRTTSPMLSGAFAHISGRNLSNQTSFTFYVRCGIEGQVHPSSSLAPQQKLSAPYDLQALEAYFAISRELKDAYPASYNDLGKLWDEISSAARTVLPMIPALGPLTQSVKLGSEAALLAGDAIRARRKAKRQRKKAKRAAKTVPKRK